MAARAGIDLHRSRTGGTDPLRIRRCGLIALKHADQRFPAQVADSALQNAGLSGAWRAHQIDREHLAANEPTAVSLSKQPVLREDVLPQGNGPGMLDRMVVVMMRVPMEVHMVMAMRLQIVPGMTMDDPSVALSGRGSPVNEYLIRVTAAGRAHQAMSISFTLSSPPVMMRSQPPHAQRARGDDNMIVSWHAPQIARPGVSVISRMAPSAKVPLAHSSKQK